MSFTYANVAFGHFSGTWNAVDLGAFQSVRPNMKLLWDIIRVQSVGRMALSKRFAGMDDEAGISIVLAETALAQIRAMYPWDNGSGAVDLTPALEADAYALAQQLILHPTEAGASTAKNIHVFKTLPIASSPWPKDAKGQTNWEVFFWVMPDHAKLAAGTPAYMEMAGA